MFTTPVARPDQGIPMVDHLKMSLDLARPP